ncbi:PEP-CTERM sorting domain-containing protein [Phragmitibacter flavus]|uniref:PEP-CTERM sorting domain-containing protein n=1 Tax=Phragmitibacter flavus TaxID=2576071 RepID=A0A5R8K8T4_9BACT|nr:autotransporter-associated beta strand repeat-containing protein [Phragmitibacter flavus]TLD68737.1 PEP-CTERM sorting domain-containing protein [Phragmitibacter flavus]
MKHSRSRLLALKVCASLCIAAAAAPSGIAAPLYFDTVNANGTLNAGSSNWSAATVTWNTASDGSAAPLVGWTTGSDAIFQTGGTNTLTLTENLSAATIQQTGAGTQTTIGVAAAGPVLTLTGNANAVSNNSGSALTFGTNLDILLAPIDNLVAQTWNAAANSSILVNARLTGVAGSAATGGLNKTGAGLLALSGANTYSGFTRLSEGILRADSATAFGTSGIIFSGGTLQYGTGINTDFSTQFSQASNTAAYNIDTNGNNVSFATSLAGNQGFIKKGLGTLSMSASNTFTGTVIVEAGMLKANTGFNPNPFGAANNLIDVRDGATLDLNWRRDTVNTALQTYTSRYNLTVTGKGIVDTTGLVFGGYLGAVTSSGTYSATDNPFTNITMTGATTFSTTPGAARWGILNINANNHDITFVNAAGISWRATSNTQAVNVRNINIEQGHVYADGNFFGDVAGGVININANTPLTTGGPVVRGALQNYVSTKNIAKNIRLNGGFIQFEGLNADLTPQTWSFSGNIELATNPLARNNINATNYLRDIKITGQITGTNGFDYTGIANSTDPRYTVLTIGNNSNNFTGIIRHQRGIIRMSDGSVSSNGTLGNTSNEFNFATAANIAILDLFGTSQNIGALNGASATNHFVQNNRTNTTSTLTVGNGNTTGDFAGILRDYGTLLAGNASTGNAAYTGDGATGAALGFRKVGTGTQTLRGASTHTGDTIVDDGTLLVRNTPGAGTAATGLGNFTANGTSIVGGTGSITGADSKDITLGTGTFLMVGNTRKTTTGGAIASELLLGSATTVDIALNGTVQVDIFANTAGIVSTEADRLKLVSNGATTVGGILEVFDTTGTSTTWTLGNSWQIIDWTGVTNRTGTFASLVLPTLNTALYAWDTSALYTTGTITVANVPEPSRALLFVLGFTLLALRRRNR